jgi:sugar O-acyltransferase (sialic acid O-acetyltransferase NeuD family)
MINIYGKGGHAKMIASHLNEPVNFYDDSDYHLAKNYPWIIGIGNNNNRKKVSLNLKHSLYINIVKGLYICSDVKLGNGVFIGPGAVIQNGVFIGNHTIINTSASVDHNCVIGNYCHIAPNSTLCGDVIIGNGTIIGAGSTILPGIEIGENCIIGAGSVVTKNILPNKKAYGNPAIIK